MSRWLLALLLTVAGAPLAPARDALTVIDACVSKLDTGLDVGYARIAARCPELAASLTASPVAALLPADWNKQGNELSSAGLADLRTLLIRTTHPAAGVRAPRVAQVASVLARLAPAGQGTLSWWARFKQWLREVLARSPRDEDRGWLRRLIGEVSLPQAILKAIVWSALALVAALAAAIIVNELRVAGLLQGRPHRASGPRGGAPAALTLAAVDTADPADRPRLLLELIVARLRAHERLPPARALTVHELTRAAQLPRAADRARLAALTAACERVRFAAGEVPGAALAAALTRGRELLAALETPALEAAGTG